MGRAGQASPSRPDKSAGSLSGSQMQPVFSPLGEQTCEGCAQSQVVKGKQLWLKICI